MNDDDLPSDLDLDPAALDELERRRLLTAEYARYSRNAAGLGGVLGGVLCLIAFTLNASITIPLWGRLLLAATPLVWIVVKEALRVRLYQRFGVVEETWTAEERHRHRRRNGVVAAVSVLAAVVVLWHTGLQPSPRALGFLAMVLVMPPLAWRYLRSAEEFKVGILLLCQAAVMLSGGHYGWLFLGVAVVFSSAAIAVGLRQHREFHRIARALAELGAVS